MTQLGSKTRSLEIQFSSANDPASSVDRSPKALPKPRVQSRGPPSGSNFPYRASTVSQPSISRVEGRKNRTLVRRRAALNGTLMAYATIREGNSPVKRFTVKQIVYFIVYLALRNPNLLVRGLMCVNDLWNVGELHSSRKSYLQLATLTRSGELKRFLALAINPSP
ncbi:hypothetical protein CFIO01_00557 [Colletotrichum fioriniae PJ7]|uniref:Uncharacterized protein n=1 Tax=Colletotrichum fioriniae PJ7 TaxID=1445577 RepID=A0A010SBC5_9PEZI|nr:hypothetical protein CFIO01_00557 [Colletotrichum fioriniae PJ7]